MRVFIAIDLPEQVRQALAQVQNELKPLTRSVRWVAPESIHVTLKFIGEIVPEKRQQIDAGLVGLVWKPFNVSVKGVGFFPGIRSPRVFWAGLEASALQGLAHQIDVRLEREGFGAEEREYRPHLTLGRARESRMDSQFVTAAVRFEKHEFGAFTVDRFHLIQSTLKPSGAVYNKLAEYPLEP